MNSGRSQSGQAFVLTVLFMTAMIGLAALVIDLGSWFRQHRQLQATADAAALAGAQELPMSTSLADSFARSYATNNTTGLTGVSISFSSKYDPNDTIQVHVQKPAPGFFSKVFGVDSVDEGAKAQALATGMQSAKYVAPFVVHKNHPNLGAGPAPLFGPGNETDLVLDKMGAPGAFGVLNLEGRGGTGGKTLSDWILNGFDGYLPVNQDYYQDPGAKFESSSVQAALDGRIGTELLFPVFDKLTGGGSNAQYHIIGWVGFHLESYTVQGHNATLHGYFTQVIWEGLGATSPGGGGPNFGARTVQLVE
jgi:putative Flp pilus-assembly TadE/G-like protein